MSSATIDSEPTEAREVASNHDYRLLADRVRAAGLLQRRPGYYGIKIVATVAALAAVVAALVVVGSQPAVLAIAVALALASTQVVFLGHDAGHLQIFHSARANRAVGLIVGDLLSGLSLGWWMPKHNAHHAHPNQAGRDPDIGAGLIAFTDQVARSRSGAASVWVRWQAWLFVPLLFLEAVSLQVDSVTSVIKRRGRTAHIERALLVAHAIGYLTLVFWVLTPWWALAFIAVHQGLFGLYLGCSFAPNHKGMPIVTEDSRSTYAFRQVVTARNITGGRLTTFIFGGLNYQIEHHLFPTMPRPNLPRAQSAVQAFCAEQNLPYHQASAVESYRITLTHLSRIASGSLAPADVDAAD